MTGLGRLRPPPLPEPKYLLSGMGRGVREGSRRPWGAPRHDHLREQSSLPRPGNDLRKAICCVSLRRDFES
eukprot:6177807-Pleurochrysis_carterae.AAC.1